MILCINLIQVLYRDLCWIGSCACLLLPNDKPLFRMYVIVNVYLYVIVNVYLYDVIVNVYLFVIVYVYLHIIVYVYLHIIAYLYVFMH